MSNETITLKRIPEPPKTMNEVAKGFWKKKCADLKAMGRLTSNILESLEAYCNHLADRNIGKCIAQSKEVSNLAGKAIALSHYELEKRRIGPPSKQLLLPSE